MSDLIDSNAWQRYERPVITIYGPTLDNDKWQVHVKEGTSSPAKMIDADDGAVADFVADLLADAMDRYRAALVSKREHLLEEVAKTQAKIA